MTISTEFTPVTGNGNGSATVFSFDPIIITDADDLGVKLVAADGTETTLTRGTGSSNYSVSVSSYPGTGSITYPADAVTPIASGVSVVMFLDVPFTQPDVYRNQGAYNAGALEDTLDRMNLQIQQLHEKVDRSLVLKISERAEVEVGKGASKYLRWNSAQTAIDAVDVSTVTVAATASDASPQDVSLSAAAAGVGTDFARDDHVHLLPTVSVAKGGTGATDAATARTNLGLTSAATATIGVAALTQIPDTEDIQQQGAVYATSGGSGGNYTLALASTPAAYAAGQRFVFKANHTNTGNVNLNVNSLGNKDVMKFTAAGGATPVELDASEILNNSIVEVVYDGTQFIVTSPLATGTSSPWVFIETIQPSGGSPLTTIDFETGIDTTYDAYMIRLVGLQIDTDDRVVGMRVGTGGTPTYQTGSVYSWTAEGRDPTDGDNSGGGTATTLMQLTSSTGTRGLGNAAGECMNGTIHIAQPGDTNTYTHFTYEIGYDQAVGRLESWQGAGRYEATTAVTAVRFYLTASGQFDGGRATLYGVKHS